MNQKNICMCNFSIGSGSASFTSIPETPDFGRGSHENVLVDDLAKETGKQRASEQLGTGMIRPSADAEPAISSFAADCNQDRHADAGRLLARHQAARTAQASRERAAVERVWSAKARKVRPTGS